MRRITHYQTDMEIEEYVYTAGPVGTEWLENLRRGRLAAGRCRSGRLILPPRAFCSSPDDDVVELVEVKDVGVVEAIAVIRTDFYGNRLERPVKVGFIRFPGVEGGLVHYLAEDVSLGDRVRPVWRAERRGSVTDIEYFEKA